MGTIMTTLDKNRFGRLARPARTPAPAPTKDGVASADQAHWPLLAAGMLSQACPSAAPLFHSCAMLLSVHKAKAHKSSLKGMLRR